MTSETAPVLWQPCGPIRGLADIEALERTPIDEAIGNWDINAWIDAGCRADPDKIALSYFPAGDPRDAPVETSFRTLTERSIQAANLFHSLGIGRSDVVMFLLPMLSESFVVLRAAMASGIACSVNWSLKPDYILDLIRTSKAKVVIALGPTPGFQIWEMMEEMRPLLPAGVRLLSASAPHSRVRPDTDLAVLSRSFPADKLAVDKVRGADDLVAYIHSGGTTGAPKLVKLTSRGFVHKCWALVMTMAFRRSDVLLADMPTFHIAGFLSCVVLPLVLGCRSVIPTPMGARDKTFVANYWRFVERMRVTFLHAVPATLSVLAQNPPTDEDISSLHDFATTGSTALPVEVAQTIERTTGIRLVATYGATEFTQNVTQAPRDGDPRYGSSGLRNPYTDIRIAHLDANGVVTRQCAPDEVGCVLVRSPGSTPGYLDAKQDRSVLMGDGWINNGDLGRLDADGFLWITGRAKDLIIRSGHNIDPSLIEQALLSHPSVFAAAAVGAPDPYAGELPSAYVQLKATADVRADDLIAHVRAKVADPTAVPREVVFIPEMPLTDVRKIDKAVLRHDAARRVFEAALMKLVPAGMIEALSVGPDATRGTVASITLKRDTSLSPAERERLASTIDTTLRSYTIAYELRWSAS